MLIRQDRSSVVTMGLCGTLSGTTVWVSLHVAGADWTDGANFSAYSLARANSKPETVTK